MTQVLEEKNNQKRKKKKRNRRLPTILCVLLLLIGLGVLLYPTACDLVFRYQAAKEIAQYNKVAAGSGVDYSELWEAAESYNHDLAESGHFSVTVSAEYADYVARFLNPLGTGMMGYVDIPKISVHIPIYQGTQESALQAGAGFWLGTSLPTGGESTHTVLTAHNGLVKAKMFTDIDQLEIGDTFSIQVLDRILTYEVDQSLVVDPDNFEPLKIVPGEDLATLYTCTPYGVNTHRLLVRGHRVETVEASVPVSEVVIETAAGLSIWQILVLLLFLLVILILLWYLFSKRKRGKGRGRGTRHKKAKEFQKLQKKGERSDYER